MTDPTLSRLSRRSALGLVAGAGAAGLLAACTSTSQPATAPASGSSTQAAPGAAKPVDPSALPSYYPADYAQIIDASRKEGGKLLVYSIMSKANWAPVIEDFKKRYSWIEIDAPDLDSATLFDRYYTEAAGNTRTADMVMTSPPDTWQEFIKRDEVVVYKSPEDAHVPEWSKLAPGVYTVSSDPMVFIHNKKLLPALPKSMAELADLATKNPGQFTPGKIVTYEETNGTGFAGNWFWAKKVGQDKALELLGAIGKTKPKLESSAGRMVDATIAGETLVGYFVSAISVLPQLPKAAEVLGYGVIEDGTPLIVRGQAITKKAQAPNSAKLLLDYVLSPAGQLAWARGGLTAYRDDVKDEAPIHLSKIAGQLGQDKLLPFSFDPEIADKGKAEAFRAKVKTALGR